MVGFIIVIIILFSLGVSIFLSNSVNVGRPAHVFRALFLYVHCVYICCSPLWAFIYLLVANFQWFPAFFCANLADAVVF